MSRILIIEDEESIASLEKDYLELSGFEVDIETDGSKGLTQALTKDYDLYILDLMAEGESLTVKEITEAISEKYLSHFAQNEEVDESTIRKKLKEYEQLGMLKSMKVGRELVFSRVTDNIDLDAWQAAIEFYSEADPMGVVGSFLLDLRTAPGYKRKTLCRNHYFCGQKR